MAHLDPHKHGTRAKALDIANLSVKGRHGPSQPSNKQKAAKKHRAVKKRQLAHMCDFYCSLDLDCECPACSDESLGFSDQQIRNQQPYLACLGGHDILGPAFKIARKKVAECGSFDQWYSWLKSYFPDTLAGRHAMNHIMVDLHYKMQSRCSHKLIDLEAKGNFGSDTCDLPFGLPLVNGKVNVNAASGPSEE